MNAKRVLSVLASLLLVTGLAAGQISMPPCFGEFLGMLGECAHRYGRNCPGGCNQPEDPGAKTSREMLLAACTEGAKMGYSNCLKQQKMEPAPTDPIQPGKAKVLFPDHLIATVEPVGAPPTSLSGVVNAIGGPYTLRIVNGLPAVENIETTYRTVGTISLNGTPILTLDGDDYVIELPITLVDGENAFEVTIHKADPRDGFAFLHAFVYGF